MDEDMLYYKDSNDGQKFYSDEEDEDSSNAEENVSNKEFSGIKDRMYKDKLSQLKQQLEQLKSGVHPEYRRKLKKIDAAYKERLKLNDLHRDLEIECVEREYLADKKLSAREFEEKKCELKENLLMEYEDKRKLIEQERYSLELTGDSLEYKPVTTRKLRRRGNEPPPLVEKRRKPMTNSLQLVLDEAQIEDDLKIINKNKLPQNNKKPVQSVSGQSEAQSNDPKIDNGKLFFDKKWFYKNQSVTIECKDGSRFPSELMVISGDAIIVRRVPENSRIKITLAQLAHGKYIVKRRGN